MATSILEDGRVIEIIKLKNFSTILDGTILIDIFGESYIKGIDKIDLDTRGGYLAFGIEQIYYLGYI